MGKSLLGVRVTIILLTIGSLIWVLLLPICNYFKTGSFLFDDEYTKYCGVIIQKLNPVDDYTHKGRTSLNYKPTFIIDFEGYETTEVTPTTNDYYNHKVGDKVCYSFENEKTNWQEIKGLFTFFSTIIWAFSLIVGVISIIAWAFGSSIWEA